MTVEDSGAVAAAPDPYSDAVVEIRAAIRRALDRSGEMSEEERQTLLDVEETLRRRDNG